MPAETFATLMVLVVAGLLLTFTEALFSRFGWRGFAIAAAVIVAIAETVVTFVWSKAMVAGAAYNGALLVLLAIAWTWRSVRAFAFLPLAFAIGGFWVCLHQSTPAESWGWIIGSLIMFTSGIALILRETT